MTDDEADVCDCFDCRQRAENAKQRPKDASADEPRASGHAAAGLHA
jgi:hypothetical protein